MAEATHRQLNAVGKKFYQPVPLPSFDQAMRTLLVIYDEATCHQRIALYAPLVGTNYIPRSWIQAALFMAAGGHVFANTTTFRTKLRKKPKRPSAILPSTLSRAQ